MGIITFRWNKIKAPTTGLFLKEFLAKPKKNMPVQSIKQIGNVTYSSFLEQIGNVLETIAEEKNTK